MDETTPGTPREESSATTDADADGDAGGGDAADAADGAGGLDEATVETRLEAVEQYLEHLGETTPHYDYLGTELVSVERGRVRLRQPHDRHVETPPVVPGSGINGGVLATVADMAAMAAIIAEGLEPTPLATASLDVTYHDAAGETLLVDAEVVNRGSTLATARVEAYPANAADRPDRDVILSGEATARLFDGG